MKQTTLNCYLIAFLLVELCSLSLCDAQSLQVGLRTQVFQSVPTCENAYFNHNSILLKSLTKSVTECGLRCSGNLKCQSFNVQFEVGGIEIKDKNCVLFKNIATSCMDLEESTGWKYLRLPPTEENKKEETEGMSPSPFFSTVPPDMKPACQLCDSSACSSWNIALRIIGGKQTWGDKTCFIKSVLNGALVWISFRSKPKGPIYNLSPIEYTYHYESIYEHEASDITFYFAPIYIGQGGQLLAMYIGVSTSGYYNMATYSTNNHSLGTALTGEAKIDMLFFYIRHTKCDSDGRPQKYVYPSHFYDNNIAILNHYMEQGALPIVHTRNHLGTFTQVFQAKWVVFDDDANSHTTVAVKPNGELFKKWEMSSDLKVHNPLLREYQLVNALDGLRTTLETELPGVTPSTSRLKSAPTDQTWYLDTCWEERYSIDEEGSGDVDVNIISPLVIQLQKGNSVRIVFELNSLKYLTTAPAIFCNSSVCTVLFENIPELNTDGVIEFNLDSTGSQYVRLNTFQLMNAQLSTGNLDGEDLTSDDASSRWFFDKIEYSIVFARDGTSTITELPANIDLFATYRLSIVMSPLTTFYDIDHVINANNNGAYEFHTTHVTNRSSVCGRGDDNYPAIHQLVLINKPFSLKRYAWSWDYGTKCLDETLPIEKVTLFSSIEPPSDLKI